MQYWKWYEDVHGEYQDGDSTRQFYCLVGNKRDPVRASQLLNEVTVWWHSVEDDRDERFTPPSVYNSIYEIDFDFIVPDSNRVEIHQIQHRIIVYLYDDQQAVHFKLKFC